MSRRELARPPNSLAQHFEAPENFRGVFGWVCGYSADAHFLDNAVERFTRNSRAQRAFEGRISLAMMLDPGNPYLSIVDVPGVAHLPLKSAKDRPFRLLHAKVALLGFRHETVADVWQLRLIVSTGNWTRGTLEDSLDLVWRIDLASTELNQDSVSTEYSEVDQRCTDLERVDNFLRWIAGHFDQRILVAAPPMQDAVGSTTSRDLLDGWLFEASKYAKAAPPRFMDNRHESFLSQLPSRVMSVAGKAKRNYLALGSGFFEGGTLSEVPPSVVIVIAKVLKDNDLLTTNPNADVFVNPAACQSVASSVKALAKAGFSVRDAGQPEYFGKSHRRQLHAKFIFSANSRANSPACGNPWIYLGSGNLTGPGFAQKASANGGNLEAGVILAPDHIHWCAANYLAAEHVLTNVLPIQWTHTTDPLNNSLQAGGEMPPRGDAFLQPPVAWLQWCDAPGMNGFDAPEQPDASFEVLNESGIACSRSLSGTYVWVGNRPRLAVLRWTSDDGTHERAVPVLDRFGRIAATELAVIDLDEAWWHLAAFPTLPDDEDLPPPDDEKQTPPSSRLKPKVSTVGKYPIRTMMQLVENIAAKQISISLIDWFAWCSRLEQCLIQASESAAVRTFQAMQINSLSPLREAAFRPDFAMDNQSPEGRHYDDLLRRVAISWALENFRDIGGAP